MPEAGNSETYDHPLSGLLRLYERSTLGRTGIADRDFQIGLRDLLRDSKAADGEERVRLMEALGAAASAGVLTLDRHARDRDLILKIRVSAAQEEPLFAVAKEPSPTTRRTLLAGLFESAACANVPPAWEARWRQSCARWAEAARTGGTLTPFPKEDPKSTHELLALVPRVLAWPSPSLIRFASCVLCGDSKRLQQLAGRLEEILQQVSGGELKELSDVGILPNPRFALVHGPLRLEFSEGALDLGLLTGAFRLSGDDILRAGSVTSSATRCLIIENETTFHELAKLRAGALLIQSSFPGRATLKLIERMNSDMEFWHFGDTDVEGFEILRDLRERSGRRVQALHMTHRPQPGGVALTPADRRRLERLLEDPLLSDVASTLAQMLESGNLGNFEQESLGRPLLEFWPFYPTD